MSDMNSSPLRGSVACADAPGWEVTPDQLKQLGMFYHCRADCLYQDGSTSKAPTLLFAGADYEPGDGPTRLHDDAKYVDEPAIIYVRLDSYLAALKPAPTDEPEPNTPPNRLMPDVNACGVWCPSCGAHLESPARSGTRRIIGKEALERLAVAALQLDEGKFDARHDYREALEELRVIAASEAGNCTSGQNDGPELHGNTKAARSQGDDTQRSEPAPTAEPDGILSLPDDDEPQNWKELAEACLADMERYASDPTSARMMVSVRGYKDRAALLSATEAARTAKPEDPALALAELEDSYQDRYKGLEQSWMVLKDQYSELAHAIGVEGDAWFGDPLASHEEVLEAARSQGEDTQCLALWRWSNAQS